VHIPQQKSMHERRPSHDARQVAKELLLEYLSRVTRLLALTEGQKGKQIDEARTKTLELIQKDLTFTGEQLPFYTDINPDVTQSAR